MNWRRVGAGVAAAGTLATGGTVAVDAEINPYEVSAEKYELANESTIESAGENKIEAHRDRPAVTLSKWNGEAAMTVAYRAITGRRAFSGPDTPQILYQVVHGTPTRPRELVPSLPKDVETVLAMALAKRPSDRFATAAELATALSGAIVVPIFSGDEVVGALGVANRSERTFGESEIADLIAAARVLAARRVPLPRGAEPDTRL